MNPNKRGERCRKRGWRAMLIVAVGVALRMTLWMSAARADGPSPWENWMGEHGASARPAVVENRKVEKTGHLQLLGPAVGTTFRNDLQDNLLIGFGARYYFSETQGWEILHLDFDFPSRAALIEEIADKTSFHVDSKTSRFQLGSAYVYAPIYGKYAWSYDHIVYFDIYGLLGAGLRFTDGVEPYAQIGIGMDHYLFADRVALVPEARIRAYAEDRTGSTLVLETIFQLGVTWLF